MKRLLVAVAFATVLSYGVFAQKLIVRMDDTGGAHSMNAAIMKCFEDGIGTDTEILAVGPWFLEAARLCNEHPGLDVGIHLAITSEWQQYKWRPITHCPSLCDEDGYLKASLSFGDNSSYDLAEVESELRAQIELALKYVKNVSHLSDHMMFTFVPGLGDIVKKLSKEYGLRYQGGPDDSAIGLESLGMIMRKDGKPRSEMLLEAIKQMEPGKTYWTIEHPAFDDAEMSGMFTRPGENVGADRQDVTDAFMSPEIMKYIKEKGIELTTFADFYKTAGVR